MPRSGVFFEKKKDALAKRVLDFYEDVRYNYLSAKEDPKEYGKGWQKSVKKIRDDFDGLGAFTTELKRYLDEETVFHKDALNPESNLARDLYQSIKTLRYNSQELNDPFAKQLGEKVIETLVSDPPIYAMFIHYALRAHAHNIPSSSWEAKDLRPDTMTEGAMGLDLALSDVPQYIIEHYGDDVDTSKVKSKFKPALGLLKEVFLISSEEEEWEKLVAIDLKKAEKSKDEKAEIDFIIPNKPMYRIFEVDDINELKGFSGEWLVQEKYDGIRIQLHKINDKIKIYTYNEKDITKKCKNVVEKLKQKQFGDLILDGELILHDKDEPLHRADTISHLFKGKYPKATLKARVFDIMHHEGDDLTETPLRERINTLFYQLSQHSSDDLSFPSKRNTRIADSLKEISQYSKDIMDLPTSEGVVIKDLESTYYIGTKKNPKWIKMKKFVDLDVIVLGKKKTQSNLYSYSVGVGPLTGEEERKYKGTEHKGLTYLPVGKALNTKEEVSVGDIVRVKVDEVRRSESGFSLYTAKVIEIPEVESPEKLITLDLLSQEGKKSLKYDVSEALLKYTITDGIHGETDIIVKSDFDGFTIYGFEGDSLMEKNALADIDIWKDQLAEIIKTKTSDARGKIKEWLQDKDKEEKGIHVTEILEFCKEHLPEVTNDLWDNDSRKLQNWLNDFDDFIRMPNKHFTANQSKLVKKKSEKSKTGIYRLYMRKDNNIDLVIEINDKTMAWTIDIEDAEDIFNLFGKAGKFPAEVSENTQGEKLLDKGEILLGVQRHGYHEYKLDGDKFKTRLHFRVVPVKEQDTWVVWTGFKQKMLEESKEQGVWDITDDRYKKLTMQITE